MAGGDGVGVWMSWLPARKGLKTIRGYENPRFWQHRPEVGHPAWGTSKSPPCETGTLWACYRGATHGRAIFRSWNSRETLLMSAETKSGKDTLKVEKVSILVLGLCIAVLVYLVIARPF